LFRRTRVNWCGGVRRRSGLDRDRGLGLQCCLLRLVLLLGGPVRLALSLQISGLLRLQIRLTLRL
jgi:hypothetical protein